jgi:hypothetical protein
MADSFYLGFGIEAVLLSGEPDADSDRKGGEDMGRPKLSQNKSPDELKFQVLRDMHDEVLHELQEGADVPDSLVEIMGNLAATLDAWRTATRTRMLQPSSA